MTQLQTQGRDRQRGSACLAMKNSCEKTKQHVCPQPETVDSTGFYKASFFKLSKSGMNTHRRENMVVHENMSANQHLQISEFILFF